MNCILRAPRWNFSVFLLLKIRKIAAWVSRGVKTENQFGQTETACACVYSLQEMPDIFACRAGGARKIYGDVHPLGRLRSTCPLSTAQFWHFSSESGLLLWSGTVRTVKRRRTIQLSAFAAGICSLCSAEMGELRFNRFCFHSSTSICFAKFFCMITQQQDILIFFISTHISFFQLIAFSSRHLIRMQWILYTDRSWEMACKHKYLMEHTVAEF